MSKRWGPPHSDTFAAAQSDRLSLLQDDIQQLPSFLAQLAYLAHLRDPNTGLYWHPAAADRCRRQEVDHALKVLHERAFRRWLSLRLEDQKADLELYLSSLACDKATVVKTWANIESYRCFTPASASSAERQLFLSNLEMQLRLLAAETSDASIETRDVPANQAMLNLKEVSVWLRVAPRTLRLWAELGEIPAVKIGRQWRFRREDVEEWLTMRSGHTKKR